MHPKSEGNSVFPTSSGGRGIENNIVTISLTAQSSDSKILLTTDESYSLTIAPYYEVSTKIIYSKVQFSLWFWFSVYSVFELTGARTETPYWNQWTHLLWSKTWSRNIESVDCVWRYTRMPSGLLIFQAYFSLFSSICYNSLNFKSIIRVFESRWWVRLWSMTDLNLNTGALW